jgi:hypothetical protein
MGSGFRVDLEGGVARLILEDCRLRKVAVREKPAKSLKASINGSNTRASQPQDRSVKALKTLEPRNQTGKAERRVPGHSRGPRPLEDRDGPFLK